MVDPMVIFTVPRVPWSLKPIQVPRAHILNLIELLKEKIDMGILGLSTTPYSNWWLIVPKDFNGNLMELRHQSYPFTLVTEPRTLM